MSTTELQVKLLSSMAKVFPNKIAGEASQKCRTLYGQEIAFQAAYRLQLPNRNLVEYNLSVSSPIEDRIQVFAVEHKAKHVHSGHFSRLERLADLAVIGVVLPRHENAARDVV